jgi:hypothetical protein
MSRINNGYTEGVLQRRDNFEELIATQIHRSDNP